MRSNRETGTGTVQNAGVSELSCFVYEGKVNCQWNGGWEKWLSKLYRMEEEEGSVENQNKNRGREESKKDFFVGSSKGVVK
jgi:hypothetical protein